MLDSRGEKIIENYKRYFPDASPETFYAVAFIIIGIAIVLALELYGQKTRQANA